MKLEVGMYVRYKYENCIYIGKIKFISEVMGYDETLQMDIDNCIEEILKRDITKASHNIIDLIQENDFVNGHRVIFVNDTFTYASVEVETTGGATCEIIPKKDIKSILTREQFSAMEYKLGDK